MRIISVAWDATNGPEARAGLRQLGFTVDVFSTIEDGASAVATIGYDAAIVGMSLQTGEAGRTIRLLRLQRPTLRIVAVTELCDSVDRTRILNAGGDDCLPSSVHIDELAARLMALLRRPDMVLDSELKCENITFRPGTQAMMVDGVWIRLPPREADVLHCLLRNQDRPVARHTLDEQLYGFGDEVSSNAVEVHIHFLRKRMEAAGAHPRIVTLRGHGYCLNTGRVAAEYWAAANRTARSPKKRLPKI